MGTFTLNYNANGGGGAPASQTVTTQWVDDETGYFAMFNLSSSKPSRTYYTFVGWGRSSGATSATWAAGGLFSTSSHLASYSTTIHAVWKRNTAYVYYNANGGTGAPATQSHNAGSNITLSGTKPTRTGYKFLGWATSATATAKQYDAGQANVPLYTTTTLYAVWKTAASSLSAPNGDLGDALTITITREVNTYVDTITWNFGTQSGTIATKTSAGSVSWTPAVSLASEFPNSASGPCVLTCTTYNGNTLIGTTTKTITLTVPQSLAPTVSVSYADTIAKCLEWGLFVQSRSRLAFTITASGQQGASIASYSASVNGSSYNSATFTTGVLLNNGSNSYSITVTDSRGLKTVSTGTFSVVAYSNPSLTLTLCDRNDSDSEQVDIGFDFAVSPVSNNNDANYRIDYKKKGTSTWTNGTVQNLGAYSGSISDLIASLDGGDEWDIRINVIDSFQTASVTSEVGVSGNILLNSRHNGGLGILMKSQADNQLDIGKHTVFHETVDIKQRRCYANLTSAGWYRAMTYTAKNANYAMGQSPYRVTFEIVRTGASPETHKITLCAIYNTVLLVNEESQSGSIYVDKIRFTTNNEIANVDIHFNTSTASWTTVSFYDIAVDVDLLTGFSSGRLASVADAPAGETIVTAYTFNSSTDETGTLSAGNIGSIHANSSLIKRHNVVYCYLRTTIGGTLSNGWNIIGKLPSGFRPNAEFDCVGVENSADLFMHIRVYTNGDIGVFKTTTNTVSYIATNFTIVL